MVILNVTRGVLRRLYCHKKITTIKMSAFVSVVRFLVGFFNLLLMGLSIAMVGVGIAVKLEVLALMEYLNPYYAPFLYVPGAYLFVTTSFAVAGAIASSKLCLHVHSVLTLILIIVEVIFALLMIAGVARFGINGLTVDATQSLDKDSTTIIVMSVLITLDSTAVAYQITAIMMAQYVCLGLSTRKQGLYE